MSGYSAIIEPGLIHYSDRGSQYCSHEYGKILISSA
jgi:transposase InsO family protein